MNTACVISPYLASFEHTFRAHLRQTSASTLRQLYDDASNNVLIENNGVAWKFVATPFWSDSTVFNENRIASVFTDLWQRWRWRWV